jgi:chemotaxis protein CheC
MTSRGSQLTEVEQDALAELANMGVSRALSSFRQMVGQEVLLSVPSVSIISRQAASKLVDRRGAKKLVGVQQSFEGPFEGKALLIFPETQSLELVRSIVGDQHSLEDIIDLEHEALAETGNIILNGCLATIANVLKRTMRVSLPSVVRGDGDALFEVDEEGSGEQFVLFLYMDLPSIAALKSIVRTFIRDLEKQAAGHVG